MPSHNQIIVPSHFNYIGIFLTLGCNLSCSYCINYLSGLDKLRRPLNAEQWIDVLNRLEVPNGLPLTIQGGEPSIHPGFFKILKGIREDLKIDLLTNLQFDVDEFAKHVSPQRFIREAPYASIRVSYHPETMDLPPLLDKIYKLHKLGYPIALYSVEIDKYKSELSMAKEMTERLGITFKLKELLGEFDGNLHGDMLYEGAVAGKELKSCECKTSELLVSPEAEVYRCHHDLYNRKFRTGDITASNFKIVDEYRTCHFFGNCNPCDIKIKNNRFQKHGHTSVTIKNIRPRDITQREETLA